MTDIPGRNEPDPQNLRQRSFQGGADGLPDASTANTPAKYRDGQQTTGATVSEASPSPIENAGGPSPTESAASSPQENP